MKVHHEIPPEWERENIRLYPEEAAEREFARVSAECSSDSDLLRQAIRHTEQYVRDLQSGRHLIVRMKDGDDSELLPDDFKDGALERSQTIRRSLVLHKTSRPRLEYLARQLQLKDVSAVARFALRFFARLATESARGSHFFVADDAGIRNEVKFGVLSAVGSDEHDNGEEIVPLPQVPAEMGLPKRSPQTGNRISRAGLART